MSNLEHEPSGAMTRRRLGGYLEQVEAVSNVDVPEGDDSQSFIPLPPVPADTSRRSRSRRRRPWYRRPVTVTILGLLTILIAITGFIGYQVQSVMTSVHSFSTPPPVVTDNTFLAENDPEATGGPITVDTGAAQAYLEDQRESGELPQAPSGGFTGSISSLAGNSGEIVQGGAAALGIGGESAEPMTIMVMGVDARPGSPIDIGVRPDVITVLRLDPATKSCRALSIPRDTRAELPGYGETKINHALMVGGIPYQVRVTEEFLDLEIDHYLLIDFVAFQQLVDTLGGISVDVPEDLYTDDAKVFTKGTQQFDGATALTYARYRSFGTDGDLGRVERQWGILEGIADAVQGQDLVGLTNDVLPTVKDHIRTDLEAADISNVVGTYGSACASASRDNIAMVRGARTNLTDEMLGGVASFNVVSSVTVTEQVAILMGEIAPPDTSPATPHASPELGIPATPGEAINSNVPVPKYVRHVVIPDSVRYDPKRDC